LPIDAGVPMIIKIKRKDISPTKAKKRKIKIDKESIRKSKQKELSQLIAHLIK
jgi:hypothetical protein